MPENTVSSQQITLPAPRTGEGQKLWDDLMQRLYGAGGGTVGDIYKGQEDYLRGEVDKFLGSISNLTGDYQTKLSGVEQSLLSDLATYKGDITGLREGPLFQQYGVSLGGGPTFNFTPRTNLANAQLQGQLAGDVFAAGQTTAQDRAKLATDALNAALMEPQSRMELAEKYPEGWSDLQYFNMLSDLAMELEKTRGKQTTTTTSQDYDIPWTDQAGAILDIIGSAEGIKEAGGLVWDGAKWVWDKLGGGGTEAAGTDAVSTVLGNVPSPASEDVITEPALDLAKATLPAAATVTGGATTMAPTMAPMAELGSATPAGTVMGVEAADVAAGGLGATSASPALVAAAPFAATLGLMALLGGGFFGEDEPWPFEPGEKEMTYILGDVYNNKASLADFSQWLDSNKDKWTPEALYRILNKSDRYGESAWQQGLPDITLEEAKKIHAGEKSLALARESGAFSPFSNTWVPLPEGQGVEDVDWYEIARLMGSEE